MADEAQSSLSPSGRAAIAGMADERRPNDEPRSPLSPGGHEAVDLGEDDGPVTYQACDFADLDRVGDRDAVPVYNVDPRNGTPKRKEVKLDVPWPPPSPPLSPTEEAQQLVKMMMCAGFDERGRHVRRGRRAAAFICAAEPAFYRRPRGPGPGLDL